MENFDLTPYDVIVLNTSGGKDSQTMIRRVHTLAVEQGVADRLVAVHADLGRMEWAGTRELAERQAEHYGIRFLAIARPQGDILSHVTTRGMWPSSAARYCTSDHKRGQCSKLIVRLTDEKYLGPTWPRVAILNCFGFRAQESPARAKVPILALNARLTNGKRTVNDWLPIRDMTEAEVWADIHESGVEYHDAYDKGMPRLSCVFCIFAPRAALIIAGKHNLELLREYVAVERKIDHTFRMDLKLADILTAVEAGEQPGETSGEWNM